MIDTLQKLFSVAVALPPLPKLLLSTVVVFLSALVLVVLWTPPVVTVTEGGTQAVPVPDGGMWPQDRTVPGLIRRLQGLSAMNAQVLKVVAHGGQYGVYPADVAKALKIDRDVAVPRAKELERDGLLTIQALTDFNFRIDKRVIEILRPGDAAQFFDAYLPDK